MIHYAYVLPATANSSLSYKRLREKISMHRFLESKRDERDLPPVDVAAFEKAGFLFTGFDSPNCRTSAPISACKCS